MLPETFLCLLLFLGMVLGLSRPWAGRLGFTPAETLVAGAALSLIVLWFAGWAFYLARAPAGALWILPAAAAAALVWDRRAVTALARDPEAGSLMAGQALVTAWGLCLLPFIRSFSGGAWIGDWFEHWERTLALLHHWPHQHQFLDIYSMPARPPLANVVSMILLGLTQEDFAHQQIITTAFSSLAYLPAALLARRFAGSEISSHGPADTPDRASRILTVLFLLNPLFVQNATFPWTKLAAAFFVLAGLYFFLRSLDAGGFRTPAPAVCGACLAAGILAHYSAGPYVVTLGAAWLILGWSRRGNPAYWRATVIAGATGACVLASWFAWSLAVYGSSATFLSNTSVTSLGSWQGSHLERIVLNVRDTLVPHVLRPVDRWLIRQTSPWGYLRDVCFQCYQLNLPLAIGSLAWIVVAREAIRAAASAPTRQWIFWTGCLTCFVVGGIAVYGDRDVWGLAHLCLQPVVLLALAFLAARWQHLGPIWRGVIAVGATVDLCLGIALHFAIQDLALDERLKPAPRLDEFPKTYTAVMRWNLSDKLHYHLVFFSDVLTVPRALVLALLAALLILALLRCRKPSGPAALQPARAG